MEQVSAQTANRGLATFSWPMRPSPQQGLVLPVFTGGNLATILEKMLNENESDVHKTSLQLKSTLEEDDQPVSLHNLLVKNKLSQLTIVSQSTNQEYLQNWINGLFIIHSPKETILNITALEENLGFSTINSSLNELKSTILQPQQIPKTDHNTQLAKPEPRSPYLLFFGFSLGILGTLTFQWFFHK